MRSLAWTWTWAPFSFLLLILEKKPLADVRLIWLETKWQRPDLGIFVEEAEIDSSVVSALEGVLLWALHLASLMRTRVVRYMCRKNSIYINIGRLIEYVVPADSNY